MSASKAFAFSLALLLGAGAQASAQSTVVFDDQAESGSDSSGSISSTGGSVNGSTAIGTAGGYFWVQGDFGERPGVRGNYASFGAFAPIDVLGPNQRLFIDSQIMVNNTTELGTSVGLGYRNLVEDWGSIFGVNSFYTYDKSQRGFGYNQGGGGLEWLTNYFQLTGNVYIPFETQPNNLGPVIQTKNSIFVDNHLAFIDIQHAEAQTRGGDFDLAVPIPGAQWISVAGGGYRYDAKNADPYNGVRARVQTNFTNVMLNLSYAHDKIYGNQVNFAATYLLGAQGAGNYSPRVMSLYDRLNSRVTRQARINTQQVLINPLELAINARTGTAWTFAHVDNTALAGGTGSNSLRYNNLGLATGNGADAILVHRGTTTRTNLLPGGNGLVLNDFQLVLGEGIPTFINVANRPGVPCSLPNWATTGTNPFVTADAGHSVIALANHNLVQGLNIIAPAGQNAIVGNGIQDFTIRTINKDIDPTIVGPNGTTGPGGGILLTNAHGTGTISDFGFNIPSTTGPSGILINNTNTAPLNVTINNGRFLKGGKYGIGLNAKNSNITATINNVKNTGSATGLLLQATNAGDVAATVTNSTFDNAVGGVAGTGDGIAVIGNNGQILLNATNTTAKNAARDGLHIDLANNSRGTVTLNTVDVSAAHNDAILSNLSNSQLNLTATGVTGTGATKNGYEFGLSNGSRLMTTLTGGDISHVGGTGILGNLTGGSKARVEVTNIAFDHAGGNGLFVTTAGTSQFMGSLTNSALDHAGMDGVRLDTAGTSHSTLFLTNSDASNAGQNGLIVSDVGNSRTDLVLSKEKFDNAGIDAINLSATSNSLILVAGDKVSGSKAGDDGIQINANKGRVGLDFTNTGSFAGPHGDGITFTGTNKSAIDIQIAGSPSSFNGAGGNGIIGSLTDSKAMLTLTDVTFMNAHLEGIGVTALNSTFNSTITNGSFNHAGGNGARLTLSNSTGNLTLDNTDLFHAGGDGLQVIATNASGSRVRLLNGISVDNAGHDAIHLDATNSTILASGSQVTGSLAGNDAIHVNANNGQVGLLLQNSGTFSTPHGDGIDFTGTNASILNIQVQGMPVSAFDHAGRNGVIGLLTGNSKANLGLVNTNFDHATLEGIGVTATDSTFTGLVSNGSFNFAGGNAARLTLNNSTGNLTLSQVSATNAGGNGFIVTGTNNSHSLVGLVNGVQLDHAALDAIHVQSNANSRVQVFGSSVSGSFAGGDAIDVSATNSSLGQVVLNPAGSFSDAGGDGIRLNANNSSNAQVVVNGPGANFDRAGVNGVEASILGGSLGTLFLNDVSMQHAANDGIQANVDGNSKLQGNLTKVLLDHAGGDAFDLTASNSSRIEMVGTQVSGSAAGGDGIKLLATTNSRIDMNLSATGSFAGAGKNGIEFNGTGASLIDLVVAGTPSSFDGATNNGIIGTLNGSQAFMNLTNVTFRNAGQDGLHLDLTNSILQGTIVGSDFSRPGPAPSGDDGLDVHLNASLATLNLTGTSINNAGTDTIHLEAINASLLNMKLTGGTLLNAGGDMTDLTLLGGSVINLGIDPAATGANQNGVKFVVANNSILNAIITNSPTSVASDPVGQNGILGTIDTNAVANIKLVNSSISNAALDGINVNVSNGGTFNATIINSSISNAGGDGIDLTLTNAFSNITLDNSDLDHAVGDGIKVNATNSQFRLNLSGGIAIDHVGANAMEFNANNSTFNIFGNRDVTATHAGLDALHINAINGSTVNSTFGATLALDNAGDNAIDVTALNSTVNVMGRGLTTGASATNDAIRAVANTGNLSVQLFNAGSFANAGGDGVDLTANNSQVGLRLRGAAAGAANFDGAKGNGILANLTAGSVAQFDVKNFSLQGEGLNGINLGLNSSSIINSTFVNGQVDNNGQLAVVGSRDGLRIVADNNSKIGNPVGQVPGLTFSGVSFQNDFSNPRPQQHGIEVSADTNTFIGLNIQGANIRRNDGDGVVVNVNPNASLKDSSLAVLSFDGSFVDNNWGDGFHVRATNGIDSVVPPQVSGAIINFSNGEINNNGNFINAPATGIVGDGIGDGIDAVATGDGSVAGNTQITFNLTNTKILGNEEQALQSSNSGGGAVNFNINGGALSGGLNVPCANGPLSFVSFTLNGTTVSGATNLVLCAMNGGTMNATVANVDFSGNNGPGVVFLAETGGHIVANLSHLDIKNNGLNLAAPLPAMVNPPITTVKGAIQGLVDGAGSTVTLNLDGIVDTGNKVAGFDLGVTNGGKFTGKITNSNFSGNGLGGSYDALHVNANGAGSIANLTLNTVNARSATQDGLDFSATAGGTVGLTMSRVDARLAKGDGLTLEIDGAGSKGTLNSDLLTVDDAGLRAIELLADHGANLNVTKLNNVTGQRAGSEGLSLVVDHNSILNNFNSNTLNFANSGKTVASNAVDVLVANGGLTPVIVLNNVNGDNAKKDGLLVTATDPTVTLAGVTVKGASFQGAAIDGVSLNIANQTVPTTVQLIGVNASNAGNRGVLVNLNNVTGGQSGVVLNNVTANNAGGNDGAEINVLGLLATDSTQVNVINNSSFNNAKLEGLDINVGGAAGSKAGLVINRLTANNAQSNGIHIDSQNAIRTSVTEFKNISAINAGLGGTGDGLLVTAAGAAELNVFNAATVDVSGAKNDGVNINLDAQAHPAAITFNGLNASNAGGTGASIILDGVTGGGSVVNLTNVNATGAKGGDGVDVHAINMTATDAVTMNLNTVDVSNASADGLNVRMDGVAGSKGTLNLSGLTATNDIRDGIDIALSSGVTGTVGQFNNVTSRFNGEDGLKVDVSTGSKLTAFTANGLDLSNNGTSGLGFGGLAVAVHDAGSTAKFDLSNLTDNNSGGRGVLLNTYNSGSLTFNLTTATINQSGLGGIDANVGVLDNFGSALVPSAPGTFNGTFKDVTVTSSGQSLTFPGDGVNFDVTGAGTTAKVTFDHVVSNQNDGNGFTVLVDNSAHGTFAVNNATTGNSNVGTGFKFNADGAATVVSLTSASGVLGDNTFNNNTGDPATALDGPGVSVVLTNAVTATNLVIGASASGNDGDGIQILANDGTGVTINNFGISGSALQVNNNAGNGLLVDFFAVNGVNAFDLKNLTVTGNALDQIHAQFRQMTMDHISLDTVTTTGKVGSDDGIEIDLLDTTLTRPTANGYAFSATNVKSTNNGGMGLNLNVTESGVPDGIQTSGIVRGLIRQSEFASNAGAGVRMTFGGDSVSAFDIIDNTAGFHNNAKEGILIQVQDAATYRMTGTNLILVGANSMYNNQIVNNGGIGFHVIASEPLDTTNIVPDGVGPRIELDLGDVLRNPNTITGNVDAAMAIEMYNDSTGSFNMVNSILTKTTNGANANFNGDGLAFRLTDFAKLESLTIDGKKAGLDISDNAGSGLVTSVDRFAELGTLSRLTVLNSAIQRNGLHGIDIQRAGNGLYGPDAANNAIIIGAINVDGQIHNGNIIRDNLQNGLNVVLGNTPGAVLPLHIDVTDNTFSRNNNGIFLNATGNAQFAGNVSDNHFDLQKQDGIQVRLENDGAIGDPRLSTNPTLTPFTFDGNQILTSARDGIRFDTNFTNENGNFGGGAYANVLIRESQNFVDGFGNPIRTLIQNNGANGVHIIDNSGFVAGPGVAVTQQNTYDIIASDISNNTLNGVSLNVGDNAGARDLNSGVALLIGDPTAANQRDVQINGNGNNGIDIALGDADNITNNIKLSHISVNNNGNIGIHTTVEDNGFGSGGSLNMLLDTVDVMHNTNDGIHYDITTTRANGAKLLSNTAITTQAVVLVEMFGVDASQNGGRGLYANLQNDRLPLNTFDGLGNPGQSSTTVFNIGRGDRFNDPTAVNRFDSNKREGVVFDMQATGMDQDTTTKPNGYPHSLAETDANDDVFVDVNQPDFLAQNPAWSTNQFNHTIGGTNPGTNSGLPAQETRVHLTNTVNFIHNEVANNGTKFEDGLDFGVGSLTRLNAQIAGNSFGGNVGDDIRLFPQRSNQINPPNSFLDTANDVGHTAVVYDPVAYANIVLGSVDTNLDGTLDQNWGNGRSADANGAASNGTAAGDQITVQTFGTNQTTQITRDGVFTNADPVKGGGRSVLLVGQVQANGVWNNTAVNDFFQNGVQQDLTQQFFFFNQKAAGPFPDVTFP